METELKNVSINNREIKMQYIHLIIWIILQAAIWFIPPSGSLTTSGVRAMAVFVGFIYGILFIKQFAIPCLMCPILMGFTGAYPSVTTAYISAFGNETFVSIITVFMFSGVITYSGVTRELALRLINAKVTTGRPWVLTFFILLATALLAAFIHPLVVITIIAEICVEIFSALKMKCSRWTVLMLIDVSVIGHVSQLTMPFQFCNVITFGVLESLDSRLAFSNFTAPHMLSMFVFTVCMVALSWAVTRIVCRNCVDEIKNYVPRAGKVPFDEKKRIALGLGVFYCVIQLLPILLPDSPVKRFLASPGLAGTSVFVACLAMAFRTKNGENFMTFDDVRKFGFNWFTLCMLIALGSITTTFSTDSTTGIIPWFSELLLPICDGTSPFAAFVIIAVFSIVATNLLDDMAVVFFAVPVSYVVATAMGINPAWFVSWTCPCMLLGAWLPSSSPLIALIYALEDTGYVSKSMLIRWAPVRLLEAVSICIIAGWLMQGIYPVLV